MNVNWLGGEVKRQLRVEDERLVRGLGRFADDANAAGDVYGYFVRSTQGHARIVSMDLEEAKASPGVLAVLVGADMKANGVKSTSIHPPLPGRKGPLLVPFRPALADDRVTHVGQSVALVIATSAVLAQDAGEKVAIDYETLPAVVDARAALEKDAPQVWPEAAGNVALDWSIPADEANAAAVDKAFASAAKVAKVGYYNQRIISNPMEPRGVTASYDAKVDRYTLRGCSQSAHALRNQVLAMMTDWTPAKLRVVTDDVGGGFGTKSPSYPEYPALLVAAKITGKNVHWMATRSETFLADFQARDTWHEGELALDEKGKFLALRMKCVTNLGAFVGPVGANLATLNFARCLPSMYRIPLIDVNVKCVFTNTPPTAPYRGAGRPEANYLLERLVEEAARVAGIDSDKLRKRNFIPSSAMPYKTPVGTTYDSGDFPAVFDKAMELSAYSEFSKRKREAAKRGKLRGIGISCILEHAGGVPTEGAALTFGTDGKVSLDLGAGAIGQGHATVFPTVAAKYLDVPLSDVLFRENDTDLNVVSNASVGSRTSATAGAAIVKAAQVVIEKGRKLAADFLEAAEGDIVYAGGDFTVTGTDRKVTLFDLAKNAKQRKVKGDITEDLDTNLTVDTPQTFPNGAHVAEVEIDPQTGVVEVVSYVAVDDCGNVLNSMIIEGQLHGGLAQGLGQVLLEHAIYDDSGQLVTGSFMDYGMPRADDFPNIVAVEFPIPATTNPLGVKGAGEAGTTGALGALMNAIASAIPGRAGALMDMPATPQKVWAALQAG